MRRTDRQRRKRDNRIVLRVRPPFPDKLSIVSYYLPFVRQQYDKINESLLLRFFSLTKTVVRPTRVIVCVRRPFAASFVRSESPEILSSRPDRRRTHNRTCTHRILFRISCIYRTCMRARRVGENSTSRNRRSTISCPIAGVRYRTALFVCVLDGYFFGVFYVTCADRSTTFDFRARTYGFVPATQLEHNTGCSTVNESGSRRPRQLLLRRSHVNRANRKIPKTIISIAK